MFRYKRDMADDDLRKTKETVSEMEARHLKEMRELRERGRTAKKAAKKDGKKKVAEVDAKFQQEELDLAAQHRDEFEDADDDDETVVEVPPPVEDVASKKKAKAARKRGRARERERQKEALRNEEKDEAAKTSDRTLELRALDEKLKPLALGIHEVAADGNCLFRAVEHQLSGSIDHGTLRIRTADYMLDHADDFSAFFEGDFESHCAKLRDTPEWGGQPELLALTNILQRPIWVHSRDAPTLKMDSPGGGGDPLHLSFHRFYFALGEHYNSVVPRRLKEDD